VDHVNHKAHTRMAIQENEYIAFYIQFISLLKWLKIDYLLLVICFKPFLFEGYYETRTI
jgi:hypothetical protein